jgi:hypothetical protein
MRQAYLSIGAAIQNIALAADAYKIEYRIKLQTKKQPIAKISVKWPNKKQLCQLTSRQCNHSNYHKRSIAINKLLPAKQLEIDGASIHLITDKNLNKKLAKQQT